MDRDLDFAPAGTLAALIRARALSPSELMERTLARIERVNPRLNAFVVLDPARALAEAAAQTARLARGERLGPLGGLPLGVKDLEDAEGFVTTSGSRAFRDRRAPRDSVQVERLRAAGAIVIGKTNTPEFGHIGFTDNELFGPTRNPWNLERTPGGSSGGSAAAIAAGLVPFATASDGAGSIRIPASFCGVYGLKPSRGRVPSGPSAFAGWMDTTVSGPITRTVRDAALYLDVVAGAHPADAHSLPAPAASYVAALDEPLPRLRIAFSATLGATHVQSDVLRAVESAAAAFEQMGHAVETLDETIPSLAGWWVLMSRFQALASLWEVYTQRRDELSAAFAQKLDDAWGTGPEQFREYGQRRAVLNAWLWRLFDRYDLLLTPTMPLEPMAPQGPVPEQVEGKPCDFIAFTAPFNFGGQPAATVPAGFTASGLPVGLQIVGARLRDDLVLRASHAFEQARPWQERRPEL